jgi:integrase
VNPITGKRTLGLGYAESTINHALTSAKMFYEYHLMTGLGPVVNPVPEQAGPGPDRPGSHRSPMEPAALLRRAPYRQRTVRRQPRALPNELFNDFFSALPSNRDRAIVALGVSCGPRAHELLSMRLDQIDVGRQVVALETKGRRELEEVPASPDAFLWLAAYLAETEQWRPAGETRIW